MKNILKRLFIKFPLYVIFMVFTITLVVPLIYWLLTGKDFTEFYWDISHI